MAYMAVLGSFFCVLGEKVFDFSLDFENMASKKNVFTSY